MLSPLTAKSFLTLLLAGGLLTSSSHVAGQAGSGDQQVDEKRYQFRVSVDLISLNVTVTDTRNRFVTDLGRDDFRVFEDGIHQDISVFSQEDLPIRMILLLDSSASMEEKMSFAQQAATNFVKTMKSDDMTEVVEPKRAERPASITRSTSRSKIYRGVAQTFAGRPSSCCRMVRIRARW